MMSGGWVDVTPRDEMRQRIRDLEASLAAATERAERAESELASATDLANSWARETSVAEARDGSGLRDLIDRLWGKLSGQYHALRAELAEARRQLTEAQADTRRVDWLVANGARDRAAIDLILEGSTKRAALLAELPGLPVAEMLDRGWLSPVSDIGDPRLEDALCRFFEVNSRAELKGLLYGDFDVAIAAQEKPNG